jgi:hypothetical protein
MQRRLRRALFEQTVVLRSPLPQHSPGLWTEEGRGKDRGTRMGQPRQSGFSLVFRCGRDRGELQQAHCHGRSPRNWHCLRHRPPCGFNRLHCLSAQPARGGGRGTSFQLSKLRPSTPLPGQASGASWRLPALPRILRFPGRRQVYQVPLIPPLANTGSWAKSFQAADPS